MEKSIIVVDIETTNTLNKGGKIVEIGIVLLNLSDGEITPIYNSLIREDGFNLSHTQDGFGWIFNHSDLSYNEISNAPHIETQRKYIQMIFDKYSATAYNKRFDFDFLINRGFSIKELPCPMIVCTPILSIWDFYIDDNYNKIDYVKYPSVEEVWSFYFPNILYKEKHRGLDDAIHEAKIIKLLYDLGNYKLFFRDEEKININSYKSNELANLDIKFPKQKDEVSITEQKMLIPFRKKRKWGFSNQKGEIIIDCIFDYAEPFSNEIAKVKLQKKFGFINRSGNLLITAMYDEVKEISQGLIAIKCFDKWGFINSEGYRVIDTIFDSVFNFNCNRALVSIRNRSGYIDTCGNIIVQLIYDGVDNDCSFSEDIAKVRILDKTRNSITYKYIDLFGNYITDLSFDSAVSFNDDFGKVTYNKHSSKFINKDGLLFPEVGIGYFKINSFNEGFASFWDRHLKMWGFINKEFEIVEDPIHFYARSFTENFAPVREINKWGFINKSFEHQIPCIYDDIKDFSEGLSAFKRNNKWGYIDKYGNERIAPKYYEVENFINGMAKVYYKRLENFDRSYGYIDILGNEFWED
jgi:DNA polymerase-3 subunit epsilon